MSGTGRASTRLGAADGFTLIEMLVVLAIMALVAGLGFPAVERSIAASRFRASAADLGALLAQARYAAIREGRDIRLQTLDEGRRVVSDDGGAVDFAPPLAIAADPRVPVFFRDGSATPARLLLTGPGVSRTYRIEAHTGRIDVQ